LLSALAVRTKRIRLGTLVSCASFRNVGLLSKTASTLDWISSGRVELGIGAGWYKPEFDAFGFKTFDVRVGLFSEYIQTLTSLMKGEKVTFGGNHVTISNAYILPPPVQKPLPIWVGATRPKMLKIVAKYADRWNMRGTPEYYSYEREKLEDNLVSEGRTRDAIQKSIYVLVALSSKTERSKIHRKIYAQNNPSAISYKVKTAIENPRLAMEYLQSKIGRTRIDDPAASDIIGPPEACLAQLSRYYDLGVRDFFLYLLDLEDQSTLETFTDKVANQL
jgi:alkanesulfonate monooxygenase SsuD/methylene tetrahydromethanopterin reductase-like flavin-dependent oxidoreductase (luciferase family)